MTDFSLVNRLEELRRRLIVCGGSWLAAFVIGALLTPPDILSRLSIAGPFLLLYEVGIMVARLFGPPLEK